MPCRMPRCGSAGFVPQIFVSPFPRQSLDTGPANCADSGYGKLHGEAAELNRTSTPDCFPARTRCRAVASATLSPCRSSTDRSWRATRRFPTSSSGRTSRPIRWSSDSAFARRRVRYKRGRRGRSRLALRRVLSFKGPHMPALDRIAGIAPNDRVLRTHSSVRNRATRCRREGTPKTGEAKRS